MESGCGFPAVALASMLGDEFLAAQATALGADVRSLDPPVTRTVALAHRDATLSPAAAAFVALAISGP